MKVAVLVSGGVDSSVALQLLKNEGKYDITAFYLQIWLEDELSFLGECPWEEDLSYARAVCDNLDIPLKTVPLQKEYHARVVGEVIDELRHGHTPSPDIWCNERVKFGAFFEAIDDSFDKIASGHYAQVTEENGLFLLKQAPDPVKDQTYFLSSLNQSQLSRILFPIGHLEKHEVRDLAEEYDLAPKNRKDSQGICFLGKIKYSDFVKHHLGEQVGDVIELETGKKWGEHKGFWFHTIGQRQGLGIHGGPWYVVRKDLKNNIVYISHKFNQTSVARDNLQAIGIKWISGEPAEGTTLQAKLRHGPKMIECSFAKLEDGRLDVHLKESDNGIAPGQSIILYKDGVCLGRAVIDEFND